MTRRIALIGIAWAAGLFLAAGTDAYPTYSENRDATRCRACQGDFRASSYISPSDGPALGTHLNHGDTLGACQ